MFKVYEKINGVETEVSQFESKEEANEFAKKRYSDYFLDQHMTTIPAIRVLPCH